MRTHSFLIAVTALLMLAACGSNQADMELPRPEDEVRSERITDFDGRALSVAIPRADGSKDRFDSIRDELTSWPSSPALPNHVGRSWLLGKSRSDSNSVLYALISWDDDDPTDYLVGGYWFRFQGPRFFGGNLVSAERHTFIDGPELDPSNPPRLPETGTASYVGTIGGVYAYRYGSDWENPEAPVVADEFAGTVSLHLDFSDGTLSGCAGCIGDLGIVREHLFAYLGFRRRPEPLAPPTDYELHFDLTDIRPDGSFDHTGVSVRHPDRAIVRSSGQWAGNVSNIPDADGFPRLVAGKAAVEFDEADGSQGQFEALFTGYGESLLAPASHDAP